MPDQTLAPASAHGAQEAGVEFQTSIHAWWAGRHDRELEPLIAAGLSQTWFRAALQSWLVAESPTQPVFVRLQRQQDHCSIALTQHGAHVPTAAELAMAPDFRPSSTDASAGAGQFTSIAATRVGGHAHGFTLPAVTCLSWSGSANRPLAAGVSRALTDSGNGDAFASHLGPGFRQLVVLDGLGHGAAAAEASRRVMAELAATLALPLDDAMRAADVAARGSRGAAALVVRHHVVAGFCEAIGVGNIWGGVFGATSESVHSRPGVVGHRLPDLQIQRFDLAVGDRLILASDGCDSRLAISARDDHGAKSALHLAGLLHARHARKTDDATLLAYWPCSE